LCRSGEFNLSHSSLTSRPLRVILDNLPEEDPALATALTAPRKHPTGIHLNSATTIYEAEFSEPVEDGVEVTLEEVCQHLDGESAPEGLVEVNGGLQLGSTAAEGDDIAELPVSLDSEVDGDGLGHGKRVRHMRDLEKEMETYCF
jgi:hypothetical protein